MSDEKRTNHQVEEPDHHNQADQVDQALSAVADINGVRVLDYKADGLYLSVFPPLGKGKPLSLEDLLGELERDGVTEINKDIVDQVVSEASGEAVKIADASGLKPVSGQVAARITEDLMEAYIRIIPPLHGGPSVTKEQVMNSLANLGVVYGLDESKISEALQNPRADKEYLAAVGIPLEMGKNGELQYSFETGGIKIHPKELADGRVDFYNLNLIQNVVTGQILVTKIPPTSGQDGMTVTGKALATKPGKDVNIKAGKNTEISSDGTTLIATSDGHIVFQGGKVGIMPVYEVHGDVDLSTGNIDFVGNVIVKGNVTEGLSVKAHGDVEIRGSVAGGCIVSGGHVQISNGIQGVGKGVVEAAGNIFTKFIENCRVKAEGDIIVGEAIMHSRVTAKGSVVVGGRKGVIVGGSIMAGQAITAKTVGSSLSTNTELEAGVNPELREKYNEAVKTLEEAKANLDKTQKAVTLLKKMEQDAGDLPPDKKALLLKVSKAQFQLLTLVQNLDEAVKNLDQELQNFQRGKVNVSGTVHPGVKITIGPSVYYVSDPLQFTTFIREQAEIKVTPYK